MADEYAKPPYSRKVGVPARCAWPVMRPLKGKELEDDSLADLDNIPEPAILADEIIENIEAGLANFRAFAATLGKLS
jgi:hypothetical protein